MAAPFGEEPLTWQGQVIVETNVYSNIEILLVMKQ